MKERTSDSQGNPFFKKFDGKEYELISYRSKSKSKAEKVAQEMRVDYGKGVRIVKNPYGPTWLFYREV
jgi:hypothetical protein